jgi:hypothetical protein
MKSFKQFLIEYNIDSFEKYFNQYKKEKNDEFGESPEEIAESLRIDAGNTPEETWSNIKEYLENAFTEAEKEYEKWADFGSGSKIWSIRICDIDFETMVDEYISENGLYHLAYLDSEIDEKFFEKVLEHKMDSYSVYPEFGGHGFLFNDGSSMDIPADDHRIISMDEWFPNNIITLHLSDNILTVRLNTTSNSTQFNYLDELIQNSENNIKQVYYDVYENDMMVKHGKFDVEDDYDWYDIRTKDNNKSQLKQYR